MLLFYWLEERDARYVAAFALACWSSALYAWLAGAWPFTAVEVVWGVVALRRFQARTGSVGNRAAVRRDDRADRAHRPQ